MQCRSFYQSLLLFLPNLDLIGLYKAGISRIAYVSPYNIFNSLELEKQLNPGTIMKIKIFKNITDADLWLKQ